MAATRVFTALRSFAPVQRKSLLSLGCGAWKQSSLRSISVATKLRERYFSKDHEWIEVENNIGTVGITKYAQETLGELVYVELPEVEEEFSKEDIIGVVESVKAASDVITPVSGTTQEVNEILVTNPKLVNDDAENEGWLYKMKLSDSSELDDLMNATSYKMFCEEETD